mmetsp:Transcript_77748/g.141426  ORF Transcript_77748/g.141426 Transcript_77748/m.141426 type:complete len:416 (-) Transcript_77748:63-1310(-)
MVAYIDGKCALLLTSILLIWLLPRSRLGTVVGGSDVLLPDGASADFSGQAGRDESFSHSSRRFQQHTALQLDAAPDDERPSSSGDRGHGTSQQRGRPSAQRVQIDGSGEVETQEGGADALADAPATPIHAEVTSRHVKLHFVVPAEPGSSTESSELHEPSARPANMPLHIFRLPWMRWPAAALAELAVWKEAAPQLVQYWNATLGFIAQASAPGDMPWRQHLFLRVIWWVLALFMASLLLCATYDTARNWRHRTNLKQVEEKVRRANEVFLGLHGNLSLCPCCVEFVATPSDSAIALPCGHTFHMQCVNEWYRRHSSSATGTTPSHCPVCEGPQTHLKAVRSESSSCCTSEEGGERGARLPDSTRLFSLHCLAENFPSVTTKGRVERWALQRLGTLLTEKSFSKAGGQKARLEMC